MKERDGMWEEKKKQWRGRGRGTHLGHLNVTVDFEAMDKRIYVPLGGPRILLGVPLRQAGGHSHMEGCAKSMVYLNMYYQLASSPISPRA